jgi:hypothetical protein
VKQAAGGEPSVSVFFLCLADFHFVDGPFPFAPGTDTQLTFPANVAEPTSVIVARHYTPGACLYPSLKFQRIEGMQLMQLHNVHQVNRLLLSGVVFRMRDSRASMGQKLLLPEPALRSSRHS